MAELAVALALGSTSATDARAESGTELVLRRAQEPAQELPLAPMLVLELVPELVLSLERALALCRWHSGHSVSLGHPWGLRLWSWY